MKIFLGILLYLISYSNLIGQEITLTKDGVPRSGSRYLMKYNLKDTMFSLSQFNLTGTDNIWDFCNNNFQNIDTLSFDTILSSNTIFNSANLVATSFDKSDKLYFKFNEQQLLWLSTTVSEFSLFGGPLNPIFDNPILRYKFPMKYLDSIGGIVRFKSNGIARYDDNNNLVDSIIVKRTYRYYFKIQAKGKVKLPTGFYNSILERYNGYGIDSLFEKNNTTNWQWKFSYVLGDGGGDNYYWYTNGSIIPIVQYLELINGFMIRDSELPIGLLDDQINNANLEVYPNPVNDFIYIGGKNNEELDYSIIDNSGRNILQGLTNQDLINVKELCVGSYILILNNKQGSISHKHKFIKLN